MSKDRLLFLIKYVAITVVVAIAFMLVGAYLQWSGGVFFEEVEIVREK